jgi:hypothetical protein
MGPTDYDHFLPASDQRRPSFQTAPYISCTLDSRRYLNSIRLMLDASYEHFVLCYKIARRRFFPLDPTLEHGADFSVL